MHIALAGGVGGARLAYGLSRLLEPEELMIVVNTGDDFTHLGLRICPDLDTVMYTLAGMANPETGWGLRDETWHFMAQVEKTGGPTWFRIGDRDLQIHRMRTAALASGQLLSEVTASLSDRLNVRHRILPATDDNVRTVVISGTRRLPFQDYFVRLACDPQVSGFVFQGADTAVPVAPVLEAVAQNRVASLILCPSNPFVSIGPILAIPGFRKLLEQRTFPAVAVSPIIGGLAVKGPAAKMMGELGMPVSSLSIARHYGNLIDGLVLDEADRIQSAAIKTLGTDVLVTRTLMQTDDDKTRLAEETVQFAARQTDMTG